MSKKGKNLKDENTELKARVAELEAMVDSQPKQIVRGYTEAEFQQRLNHELQSRRRMLEAHNRETDRIFSQLQPQAQQIQKRFNDAVMSFQLAYNCLFPLLRVSDSLNLKAALEHYRTLLDKTLNQMSDVIRSTKTDFQQLEQRFGLSTIDYNIYDRFLSSMLDIHSDMKEAIAAAMKGDLSELQRLETDKTSDELRVMIEDYQERIGTTHLAQNTRLERQTVYLGIKAHQFEAQGITNARTIITRIYNDLKRRKKSLNDDELTTLEFLGHTYQLDTDEAWGKPDIWLRLEKQISRYKAMVREKGLI